MGFSRIDLNLDIGEFVAITGESGSGKSTLLNVISGLDTYEEGEMFVCGEDTTAYGTEDYENYRKTFIGNIFQDFNLINSYNVYQNIEAVMLLSGRKKRECRERILELIDLVGLTEYKRTKASKLSGGQKQRVAIARALAKDAPIIVADEPTGNLDSASADIVMSTLSKVSAEKLVVIVTHNYEQAEPYVTRKLTMHDGRIIEDKYIESENSIQASATQNYEEQAESAERGAVGANVEQGAEGAVTGRGTVGTDAEPAADGAGTKRSRKGNRIVRTETQAPRKMSRMAELRLGLRNTFNLPTKFILLFIVYFFVSTAVLGQYATIVNSLHEGELLGSNQYFLNSSSDRLVIKKKDESSFNDADFKKILSTENIRSIVKNDIAVDNGVSFILNDYYLEGPVMPLSDLEGEEIPYGKLPTDDYEIVVKLDSGSDYIVEDGESALIGQKVEFQDMSNYTTLELSNPIKVGGIMPSDDEQGETLFSLYGYSTIYASEKLCNELLISQMANASKTEMNFGGTRVPSEGERAVYFSSKVPEGKVYIFEDQSYYYDDDESEPEQSDEQSDNQSDEQSDEQSNEQPGSQANNKIKGKDFSLKVSNRFFESTANFKVADVITERNITSLIGVDKEEYDMFYNCVFINDKDYNKLFDKGYFQISAYMENEANSGETVKTLQEQGFTVLALKDTLSDMTEGNSVVIQLIMYGLLIIELIVLFWIAYAVIRLIMRSRNQYYSTLRILGATKKNTDTILRVELILMMIIAYSLDLLFVVLVKRGIIEVAAVNKLLFFLTPIDYAALAIVLLLMSLLIANRYSKSIFTKSAMKAFREEA